MLQVLCALLGAAGLVVLTGSLPALADDPSPSLTYVAMGASDALGVGASDPSQDGWVPRFASLLGPDTRLVNLGVYASTLHDALSDQLPAAVEAQPDVVTVWLAVNDLNDGVSLARYQADLDELLEALQQGTQARVLVGNVPDLSTVAAYHGLDPRLLRLEIARWNATILATAERHGATVVDLSGYWQELGKHPEYVSADGFHPSGEGYERIAELFYETAQTVLRAYPRYASNPVMSAPTTRVWISYVPS